MHKAGNEIVRGRIISRGTAEGDVLYSSTPISFLGDIDPKTGNIINKNHELFGTNISGKILVFPHGIGSTVGSYVMYQLKKNGLAPLGIINQYAEPIVAVGAIISQIPMLDKLNKELSYIKGKRIKIDANKGIIKIVGVAREDIS
ncbi:MAG: DUF126 domain-containing protein [Candidatus Hydrothermarchaeota archaeon]